MITDLPPPSRQSEQDLLDAVRAGDMPAYAELWKRYRDYADITARRVTSSLEPEDLASEAFARVLQALRNGAGPSRYFGAYLRQSIVTVAALWGTRQASAREVPVEHLESMPSADVIVETDERMDLHSAFGRLSPRWRTVLWLSEVDGRSSGEVAEALGISVAAARTLVFRARVGLREAWATNDPDIVDEPLRQPAA